MCFFGGTLREVRQFLALCGIWAVVIIALIGSMTSFGSIASAQTEMPQLVLPAKGIAAHIDLNRFMERLQSDLAIETPVDLIDTPSAEFERVEGTPAAGYIKRMVWYRLPFSVTAQDKNVFTPTYIEIGPPHLNEINVFVIDDKTRNVVWNNRLGDRIPNGPKTLSSLKHLSEWPVLTVGQYWLIIGIQTTSAHIFQAKLYAQAEMISDTEEHNLLHSSFLGVLLVLFGVYLTFGIITRDKSILCYSFYVASILMINLGTSGYAQLVLKDIWPHASDFVVGAGSALSIGSVIAMWAHIIRLDHYNPPLYRAMLIFSVLAIAGSVTAISDSYIYFMRIFLVPVLALMITLFIYLFYIAYREKRIASHLYFLIALGLPSLAAIVTVFALLGAVPITAFTANMHQYSSFVHLAMLAIAMGYRTYKLTRQSSKAHHNNRRVDQLAGEQRTFITMLSHEFRTPLAIIQRSAEILGLHLRSEPVAVHNRLATIRGNAAQLSGLVDAFLTKETLDSANFTTSLQPTNIDELLRELISQRNRETPDHQVGFRNVDFAVVDIDRILFERAIINLIENARKYAPGAPVWIACNRASNGFVYIRVIDDGPGIPLDDLSRVSSAFYRGQDAGVTQGVGLGLHITNRIIEAHNGSMSISVGENAGTTVMIKIPYNRKETVQNSNSDFFILPTSQRAKDRPDQNDDGAKKS